MLLYFTSPNVNYLGITITQIDCLVPLTYIRALAIIPKKSLLSTLPNNSFVKRRIKYLFLTFLLIVLLATGYIWKKLSYNGSDSIILLNPGKAFTSFQDIISLDEFKNKIVYVDVWGTSCPPCFEELKNYTPQLTQRYKNKNDIVFLYICIDRHPLPELRWKDKIQMLKPKGYHVLVEGDEEPKLAKEIIGQAVNRQFFPYEPCYFIVNKQGRIIDRPTTDPGKMELEPSDSIRLYNKLDSLRQI